MGIQLRMLGEVGGVRHIESWYTTIVVKSIGARGVCVPLLVFKREPF